MLKMCLLRMISFKMEPLVVIVEHFYENFFAHSAVYGNILAILTSVFHQQMEFFIADGSFVIT